VPRQIPAGEVGVLIGGDDRGFQKAIGRSERSLTGFATNAVAIGKKIGIALGAGALAGGGFSLAAAGQVEQIEAGFESLVGGARQASRLMAELNDFAARTPNQITDIASAARQLIPALGGTENLTSELKVIGDIAAGANVPLNDMASIFVKITNKGKAFTEELNQLSDRGIPIINQLSTQLGVAREDVFKLASQGKLSADIMNQAFRDMTSTGGVFANQMERQSTTLIGLISTLKDNVFLLAAAFGKGLLPVVKPALSAVIGFVGRARAAVEGFFENIQENGQILRQWFQENWRSLLSDFVQNLMIANRNWHRIQSASVRTVIRIFMAGIGFLAGQVKQFFEGDWPASVGEGFADILKKATDFAANMVKILLGIGRGEALTLDSLGGALDRLMTGPLEEGFKAQNFDEFQGVVKDIFKEGANELKDGLEGFKFDTELPALNLKKAIIEGGEAAAKNIGDAAGAGRAPLGPSTQLAGAAEAGTAAALQAVARGGAGNQALGVAKQQLNVQKKIAAAAERTANMKPVFRGGQSGVDQMLVVAEKSLAALMKTATNTQVTADGITRMEKRLVVRGLA